MSAPARLGLTADEWNARFPVGTPVRFWPGGRRGRNDMPVDTRTTGEAFPFPAGFTLVATEAAGLVALQFVEALEA
jgi:hypothetical protein